jgi:ketosteroid isomerase-like protein
MMSAKKVLFVAMLLATIVIGQPIAWVSGQDEQLSEELDEVRQAVTKAYLNKDLDLLLSYCHDDVIAVWQNGQVAKGHQGVRDVVNELTKDGGIIVDYSADPVVDHRTVLSDGNVVVSMGQLNDTYTIAGFEEQFELHSNWTVALAKIDGRWLITSFHVSTNAFDNETIALKVKMTRWITGAIAGTIGLVLGLVLSILVVRRKNRLRAAASKGPVA